MRKITEGKILELLEEYSIKERIQILSSLRMFIIQNNKSQEERNKTMKGIRKMLKNSARNGDIIKS